MSSIDEIWASMNEDVKAVKPAAAVGVEKKAKKPKLKTADRTLESTAFGTAEPIDYAAMTAKIAREVQSLDDTEIGVRKRALTKLHSTLFVEFSMSEDHYNEVFRDVCKKIFKRFADPVEKCREMAQKITQCFFERCTDVVPTLGYYFPALLQRIPPGSGYDEEMKVFVANLEEHEAYRRGRAVDRQDRSGTVGTVTLVVVEPSEEIRVAACNTLLTLLRRVATIGACPILHPYFQEIIMFLQVQLRDPCPELKISACTALEVCAKTEDYEPGMKFFAVALVRAILPVLRHRLAKVRVAAVTALHNCMVVPDRAKRKAAGSEAITDLVGFREDNVLPIAAFYKAEVQINHLAELVIDKSLPVREALARFLYVLLTEIGDRYDHHSRLLPYVLDLMTDETNSVAQIALATLQQCGREYEAEHEDEIRDRRQYGVDGDDRMNLDKPLPAPFQERPRLGMRLYVRGISKRFLNALVAELTNWVSHTRLKSAQLLKILVVLCEEHLTMEAHTLFPSLIKALKFAADDKDTTLHATLIELFELLGRYIQPELYIYYILPRLRGDADVVAFGVDTPTRLVVIEFLQALLTGSKPSMVVPHLDELVTTLTDAFVVPLDSTALQGAATGLLKTLFGIVKGKGTKVIEAHYLATGRLSSLRGTVRKAFKFLLVQLAFPALAARAWDAMEVLAQLEADHGKGVAHLYEQHSVALLTDAIDSYEADTQWSALACPEHLILSRLLAPPPGVSAVLVQRDAQAVGKLLGLLTTVLTTADGFHSTDVENGLLLALSELLVATLLPFTSTDTTTNTHLTESTCVIQAHLDAVLAAYVFDSRWTRTPVLLGQSQRILALLLRAPLPVTLKDDHLAKLFANLTVNTAANSVVEAVQDRDVDAVEIALNSALFRGDALLRHADRILHTLLAASLSPAMPVNLRQDALTVADHLLLLLRAHCGRSKLKSFAFHERANTQQATNRDGVVVAVAAKLAVQRGLTYLLAAQNDSDDTVRNSVLRTISTAAAFVLSDAEVATLHGDERLLQSTCAAANIALPAGGKEVPVVVKYADLVTALLKQAVSAGVREHPDFLAYLNDTLRVLCVLHPSAFETVVRAELAPLLTPPASETDGTEAVTLNGMSRDELNDFVSGLLNHVEVLLQFS